MNSRVKAAALALRFMGLQIGAVSLIGVCSYFLMRFFGWPGEAVFMVLTLFFCAYMAERGGRL